MCSTYEDCLEEFVIFIKIEDYDAQTLAMFLKYMLITYPLARAKGYRSTFQQEVLEDRQDNQDLPQQQLASGLASGWASRLQATAQR